MKALILIIFLSIPNIAWTQEYREEKSTIYTNGTVEELVRYTARVPGIRVVIEDCARNSKGFTKTEKIGEWERITTKTSKDGFVKTDREVCEDIEYHTYVRNIGIKAIQQVIGTELSSHSPTTFNVYETDNDNYLVCYSGFNIRVTPTRSMKLTKDKMTPLEESYVEYICSGTLGTYEILF